jgi:glyceraldehyde 3-phosphate dehydrogenase
LTIRVAINGYGRIGRNVLRALIESARTDLEIVAINDLGDARINAHLTQYDTAHGPFPGHVQQTGDDEMLVDGRSIRCFSERDPVALPWGDLGVDVVHECTGIFTSKAQCQAHLDAGAKKVLISAPAKDADRTIVFGVNDDRLGAGDLVVSNASCTTNCLAPLVKPLAERIGLENGLMTTVHAYTNDQVLTDVYHSDLRRARSATQSMIPTKTGAAAAVGLVLPDLAGRLDGFAVRVPTLNVSLVDLSFIAARETSVEEVHTIMREAADGHILCYTDAPLVSVDFNHTATSSNYDATLTRVNGRLVKVCAWYDNEWGFSNRMLDTTVAMMGAGGGDTGREAPDQSG